MKKCYNHQGNANQNHNEMLPYPVRMIIIKKIKDKKYPYLILVRMWRKRKPLHTAGGNIN
jgi:hypothetical protein